MPLFLSSFIQNSYIFFAGMFKCYVALSSTSQNNVNNIVYWIGRFRKQNECFTKINYMYTCKTYMYNQVMHQSFISTAPKGQGNSNAFNFSILKPAKCPALRGHICDKVPANSHGPLRLTVLRQISGTARTRPLCLVQALQSHFAPAIPGIRMTDP